AGGGGGAYGADLRGPASLDGDERRFRSGHRGREHAGEAGDRPVRRTRSMIDLTPLDIRKKKADFRRGLRGYESAEVDAFLDLVAERVEDLVRENASLRERASSLADSLEAFRAREQAMNEALVSAQ